MTEQLKSCPNECDTDRVKPIVYVSRWVVACHSCGMAGPSADTAELAAQRWNLLPRVLAWTKELPTEPGLYLRREGAHYNDVIRVHRQNRGLMWNLVPDLSPAKELNTSWGDYQFAGPIPVPTEASQ